MGDAGEGFVVSSDTAPVRVEEVLEVFTTERVGFDLYSVCVCEGGGGSQWG